MKRSTLVLIAAMALAFGSPVFAQRPSHPSSGGPPAGRGPGSGPGSAPGMSGSRESGTPSHADTSISHGSPNDVLSHNPAIGGKIKTLTGQDAQTACGGFKSIGQCIAAAHVAKNLNIPGGFDALKAKITGTGAVSLGKAIKGFAPDADAKAEVKKANKQASDDLNETSS
jgi:hypothetical protein